jgi:hypothetical protein
MKSKGRKRRAEENSADDDSLPNESKQPVSHRNGCVVQLKVRILARRVFDTFQYLFLCCIVSVFCDLQIPCAAVPVVPHGLSFDTGACETGVSTAGIPVSM